MRILLLAPIALVFGCAHESSSGSASSGMAESTPPPETSTTAPPSTSVGPSTAMTETNAPTANAAPPKLACAPIKVHFALDSAELYDSEKPLLDKTASCLRDNDQQRVTIVGNADERGAADYNRELGQRRAQAVASYLEAKGAAPTQVEAVISHGEESPICNENTPQCWQLNRRTAVRESCHM